MSRALAYLPPDRCRAILQGTTLPDRCVGTALFSDISGFTPLTNKLVSLYGPRRGAEEATRRLNTVYEALIEPISQRQGSVIGFSGDGMLVWFDADERGMEAAAKDAVACASAMLAAMSPFASLPLGGDEKASLVLKVALASGAARRFVVGAPEIQHIDVLAGATVDRVGAAEGSARGGEIVADRATVQLVDPGGRMVREWRAADGPDVKFAVLEPQRPEPQRSGRAATHEVLPLPDADPLDTRWKPWLLAETAARISATDERFLAELRPVAALFVRFAALDYDRDEDAPRRLDRYVCTVQQRLVEHGGALIQLTTGDKGGYLYATFGAPEGHADDCARAVAAALSLRTVNPEGAEAGPQIGVAYGRMRSGAYGSRTRRTFGVQGPPTNLAARLMIVAEPGQILVDGEAYAQAASAFHWEHLGAVSVKGRAEPVEIHAPIGYALSLDAEHERSADSPLVGRNLELAALAATVDRLKAAGIGTTVLITGSLGSGKSALLRAFVASCTGRGVAIISAVCHSTTQTTPYFAARQLASHLLGVEGIAADRSAVRAEAVRARLAEWNPDWLWRLPLLGDVLGIEFDEGSATAALTPQMRQESLVDLFVGIVQKRSQEQPLLVVVDDAHWLDESTLALIVALARATPDAPVVLNLAARPDECPAALVAVASEVGGRAVELRELTQEESGRLAARLLSGAVAPLAVSVIQSRARGNPLLVEQLVDALAASGNLAPQDAGTLWVWSLSGRVMESLHAAQSLEADGDGWRLKPQASLAAVDLGVPNSIQGMFSARLDRLDDELVMTLKVASVIGRTFGLDVLARAHPRAVDGSFLASHLASLTDAGLIESAGAGEETQYSFRHALFQEVVYQSLLNAQQQELHLAVAKAAQALNPEAVEVLASHYSAADVSLPEVRANALSYLGLAAARNRKQYANETALAILARALGLEERGDWLRERVELLHVVGRREEEQASLDRLDRFPGKDFVQVALLRSGLHEATGAYRDAERQAQAALDDATRRGLVAQQVLATLQLAQIAGREGDYRAEGERYSEATTLSAGLPSLRNEHIRSLYGLGVAVKQQGEYARAAELLTQAESLARAYELPAAEALCLTALGTVLRRTGNADQAYRATERALRLRRKIGDRVGIGASLSTLAQIVIHAQGDMGRGMELLLDALQIQRAVGNRWSQGSVLNELGIVYLLCGEYAMAEARLRESLAICEEISAEAGKGHVGCNLGMALREMGRLEDAHRTFEEGQAIALELGDALLQAQYASEQARLALDQAKWADALALAETARQHLIDLNMEVMTTADLATAAQAQASRSNIEGAVAAARECVALLDRSGGVGPDFPQRDYYVCSLVLDEAGHWPEAEHALRAAHDLLRRKADAISDSSLRLSFVNRVGVHASIVREAQVRQNRLPARSQP